MTTKKFRFSDLARQLAVWSGRPAAFMIAAGALLAWALSGPRHRGDPDLARRAHPRRAGRAHALLNLEHLEDEELERYRRHYAELARSARRKLRAGALDTDAPEIKAFAKR